MASAYCRRLAQQNHNLMTIPENIVAPLTQTASEHRELLDEIQRLRNKISDLEGGDTAASDTATDAETEQTQQRSIIQNKQIFQQSPICLTISEVDTGEFIQVNKIWCETFGYTEAEAIGKTSIELKLLQP